jgi:pimeloyl-ACP methyl ester carboxylesterase
MRSLTSLVLLSLVLFSSLAGAAPPAYQVIELKSAHPGGRTDPSAIMPNGDSVGSSFKASGIGATAVVWPAIGNGTPAPLTPPDIFALVNATNVAGMIGGEFFNLTRNHAALWIGGAPLLLPDPPSIPGTQREPNTRVTGVAANGDAAGTADFAILDGHGCCTTQSEAVLWSGGHATLLPSLGGKVTLVNDMNEAGLVVGISKTPQFRFRGVVWQNGTITQVLAPLPGALDSRAEGVNDLGEIVGSSGGNGAVRWAAGGVNPVILPPLAPGRFASASDLNNNGWVVGSGQNSAFRPHAALWIGANTVIDLNSTIDPASGWELRHAAAINDDGWIVGEGRFQNRLTGFLLRPLRTPVVVIPGILGSTLVRQQPGGNDLVWIDFISAATSNDDPFLLQLALDGSGFSVAPIQSGDIFDGFPLDVYGNLLHSLEEAGYQRGTSLFTFPYDWRMDNELNARVLADYIEQVVLPASGGDKVTFVAHSMGGLIARRVAQLRSDLVKTAVYIGTPHRGAPGAFTALALDNPLVNDFLHYSLLNSNTLAQICATFPSVFELLPRDPFIESLDLKRFLTLPESYSTTYLRSDRWVAAAGAFHSLLSMPSTVPQVQIVGSGVPTIGQLAVVSNPFFGGRDWIHWMANGDGTVPEGSALTVPGQIESFFVGGIAHQDLPNDPCVGDLVIRILQDDTQTLPSCASRQSFSLPSTISWFSGSPVRVTIRDTANRVAGVRGDGSVSEEIPGSRFFILGGNEGGFLAAGQSYTVDVLAQATGVFSLTFFNEMAQQIALFDGVPIAAGSRGTLQLDAAGSRGGLSIDVDGNGTIDLTLGGGAVSADEALTLLRVILEALKVPDGVRRSLLTKVDAAQGALARGDRRAAANILDALLHGVDAQDEKKIAPADARGIRVIVTMVLGRL